MIRPLADRIVVRRIEPQTVSMGGILIPDSAQEKPLQGEILAVGPGARDKKGRYLPMAVSVGMKITFGQYAGRVFRHEGEDLIVMSEKDVAGILESD